MYRKAAADDLPRVVAFRELSEETRRRLTEACTGRGATPILVARPALLGSPGRWAALLLAAQVLLAAVLLPGFGDISHGPRRVELAALLVVALLGWTLWLGALLLARSALLRGALPFPAGVYLFARDLVDARGETLYLVPTSTLLKVRGLSQRVELHFAAARFSFDRTGETPAAIPAEVRALRDALDRAEAQGDLATQRSLDPFVAERALWLDAAPAQAPRRGLAWLYQPVAPLVALATLLGGASSLMLPRFCEQSDLRGIDRAARDHGNAELIAYLRASPHHDRAHHAADEALFQNAMATDDVTPLLAYLEVQGERRVEASEVLFARASRRFSDDLWLDLIRLGAGPRRDEADEKIFWKALDEDNLELLERYGEVGAQGARVRSSLLPRKKLERAVRQGNPRLMRGLIDETLSLARRPSQETDQAIRKALVDLYDGARLQLSSATNRRSPLAQGLDAALAQVAIEGGPLLLSVEYGSPYSPYQDDPRSRFSEKFRQGARQALGIYLDSMLLPLRDDVAPAPGQAPRVAPRVAISYEVSPVLPEPRRLCEITAMISVSVPGKGAPFVQKIRFKATHVDQRGSGRSFEQSAQVAVVEALLGE